jgi:transposase InsO family protein
MQNAARLQVGNDKFRVKTQRPRRSVRQPRLSRHPPQGGCQQSMSRSANCYDNAFIESCFGTIKTKLDYAEYDHCHAARTEIASYLAYYNTDRRHSALNYLCPAAFEGQLPTLPA